MLEFELPDRSLREYTQVIIKESDRLQTLVDRLLEPHRHPHIVSDLNIHEVLERVRSVVLAEFPSGLDIVRDYDASLPDLRGDMEQLIQAVLNIVHNAAQALAERVARAMRRSSCGPGWPARSPLRSDYSSWHWTCMSLITVRASPRISANASSTRWCRAGMAVAASVSHSLKPSCSSTRA